VWLGWVDLAVWFGLAGCAALGKYFDPEGDRDRRGLQTRHMAGDKISKAWLGLAWRRKDH